MRPLAQAAALLFAACGAAPVQNPEYSAREVVPLGRWQVIVGDEVVGQVVHLEIRDPAGPLRYFRVEDDQGRWLGHASEFGRFSRRVPFADDEQDLGVWSMARGVGLLFEASAPVRLEPVAVEAVARPGEGLPR